MERLAWRRILVALVAIAVAAIATQYLCCREGSPADSSPLPRERVPGVAGIRQPRATPEAERIDPAALRMAADYAAARHTRALIVSRHGHIVFEQYWHGASAEMPIDADAFNRTITAFMVGIALDDRKLGSIDDPVAGTTIRALLESADPQALVPLIEQASGQRYAEYLSRRLWKPLDAGDAFLSLDRPGGTARADCCFFARSADWMRIAQLLMNDGVYQGTNITPTGWVNRMLTPTRADPNVGMQVRLGVPRHGFHLAGARANRLWLAPTLQLAVLRLGEEPRDWDEARIPELVIAGVRDPKPVPATDLSTLVPGH